MESKDVALDHKTKTISQAKSKIKRIIESEFANRRKLLRTFRGK
jgi:hypothetical protein